MEKSKEQYQRVLVKLNKGQWPWNSMTSIFFFLRIQIPSWAVTFFILQQWLDKIDCIKSNVSWTIQNTYK